MAIVGNNFNKFLSDIADKISNKFDNDVMACAMRDPYFVMELAQDFDLGRSADEAYSMRIAEVAVTYAC